MTTENQPVPFLRTGDFSTLVKNADGAFTRTLKDGTQTTYTYDPASQVMQIMYRLTATWAVATTVSFLKRPGIRCALHDGRGTITLS